MSSAMWFVVGFFSGLTFVFLLALCLLFVDYVGETRGWWT